MNRITERRTPACATAAAGRDCDAIEDQPDSYRDTKVGILKKPTPSKKKPVPKNANN